MDLLMDIVIGEIAKENFIVSPSTKCEDVYAIFEKETGMEGIIVCENQQYESPLFSKTFY